MGTTWRFLDYAGHSTCERLMLTRVGPKPWPLRWLAGSLVLSQLVAHTVEQIRPFFFVPCGGHSNQ